MPEKGVIGIAVLWLLMAISALSFCAVSLARAAQTRTSYRFQDMRAIYAGYNAALLANAQNFEENTMTVSVKDVKAETKMVRRENDLVMETVVEQSRYIKKIEIGWEKVGDEWKVAYWREVL